MELTTCIICYFEHISGVASSPAIYHPRRPRASPLWQVVRLAWDDLLSAYEKKYRPTMGPLRPESVAAVEAFSRCGDLAVGFTRHVCTDCGHQHLLAFTCKARHLCPACHQRRTLQIAHWIAHHVCLPVPHRQFVFTIPKILRGIFRKRRHLLTHLFHSATTCLRDAFRTVLNLPDGRLAAAAAVHTFGDYLVFHPHLHVLAAHGLFDDQGRFHCLPDHCLAQLTELFRHQFLHALHEAKLVSDHKIADLLSWKNSGFHVHADTDLVRPSDIKGRQRLAEYLLRAPFSLQKITWNPETHTVIYRSRRSYHTKANFQVFTATDFLAAVVDHIPPKGQQTIRYYGLYSNRSRGSPRPAHPVVLRPPRSQKPPAEKSPPSAVQILLIPPPEKATARALRPLWRDLIQSVWATDPLQCPCCRGSLRRVESISRPEAVEFFLRLHGLWEGLVNLPPPPDPPFDIDTLEPINPPWPAIREWIPADDTDPQAVYPEDILSTHWVPTEIRLDDERTLVLDPS